MNFEKKQEKLFLKVKNYLNKIKEKEIDLSVSSFAYLTCWGRTVGYARLKIWILGYSHILTYFNILFKEAYKISHYQNFKLFNVPKDLSIYNKLIISWCDKRSFNNDGSVFDRYFNINSKKTEKTLWILISMDDQIPEKLNKNISIFYKNKNYFSITFLFKVILNLIYKNNFNLIKFSHEFSFPSFLANSILKEIELTFNSVHFENILMPYEGQPFQQVIFNFFKKKKSTIKTQGYIHNVITAVPTEYFFRSGSPDELLIHGESQSEILTRYLEWPKNRIKLIKSFMRPLKIDEYFQYIYLPFQIENFNSVFILFENLIMNSKKNNFKNLKVKIHPNNLEDKKNINYKIRLDELLEKYKNKFSDKNYKEKTSFVFGFSSLIFQLLENDQTIIQISSIPELEVCGQRSGYWKNLKVDEISKCVYFYSLNKKSTYIDYPKNITHHDEFFLDY